MTGQTTWGAEQEARAISMDLLDVTGRALETGDFARFAACFTLPSVVETGHRRDVIRTQAELRTLFDRNRAHFREVGITQIVRATVAARFAAPDEVEETHESHLMAGDRRVRDPYPVFCRLRRGPQGWQIAYSNYAIDSETRHGRALSLSQTTPRDRAEAQDRKEEQE